jgi:hypothetical protein
LPAQRRDVGIRCACAGNHGYPTISRSPVNDLDATCTLYRRLFDTRVLIEYESDGRIALRQIGIGTAVLSIHQAGNGMTLVAARPTIGAADICLRWDGTVNDALTLLASQDIAVVEGPVSRCTADGTAS